MGNGAFKAPERVSPWWRTVLVIYGGVLVLLGFGALLTPLIATLAASVMFGALLFISGVTGLFAAAIHRQDRGFVWRLLWAILATLAGLCIYFHPWGGALALTLVLGASLIGQGLTGIGHAFAHRHMGGRNWGWMAAGGVATAVLGGLLVWMLPHAGIMVPGFFLAMGLVSFGMSLIASGLAAAGGDRE